MTDDKADVTLTDAEREATHWRLEAEVHRRRAAAAVAEIARLRLTEAEREAIATAIDCVRDRLEGFSDCEVVQATLRGLLERLSDRPQAIANCDAARLAALQRLAELDEELGLPRTPNPPSTPTQGSVQPEWMSKPYWVDPPSGHRYGFPRLYDPATDGGMTEWMVRHGYPQHLADKGLPCTFTAGE